MRFSRFVFPLCALFLLSACASASSGPNDGPADFANWMAGKPSTMDETIGAWPKSYSGQNSVWREVKSADGSVSTFVEEEAAVAEAPPAPPASLVEDATMLPGPGSDYGQLAQEIFFAHGSASLTSGEKNSLQVLADSMKHATGPVAVTVVGHASTRVDGVEDPVRRKVINFEMAQKRANTVTRELGKAGVSPDWVQALSKGDEEPNPNPGQKSQEAADRRVEIYTNGR